MTEYVVIAEPVRDQLHSGGPVVALESTLITHGLPWPQNLECARSAEQAVITNGAVPATIAIIDGQIRVGIDDTVIERLARTPDARKVSRRDLAIALATGQTGATTVSATMICAARVGIEIFATGGIGGVHRGAEQTFDVSADLAELGQTPVTVVCAGAKVILDLPKTLEVLETSGVPVIGFGCKDFPGFFSRTTGLPVDETVESPGEVAALIRCQRDLGLTNGILVAQPPPAALAIDRARIEDWLETAIEQAEKAGITGKALTPFLLSSLAEQSNGETLRVNLALIEANAALAARISCCL